MGCFHKRQAQRDAKQAETTKGSSSINQGVIQRDLHSENITCYQIVDRWWETSEIMYTVWESFSFRGDRLVGIAWVQGSVFHLIWQWALRDAGSGLPGSWAVDGSS